MPDGKLNLSITWAASRTRLYNIMKRLSLLLLLIASGCVTGKDETVNGDLTVTQQLFLPYTGGTNITLGTDGSNSSITFLDPNGDGVLLWNNASNRLEFDQQVYLTDSLVLPALSSADFYGLLNVQTTGRITTAGSLTSTFDAPVSFSSDFEIDAGTVTFSTAGGILVESAIGIDYNPGSDIDADIFSVGVTGTPRFYWDESADQFVSTKGISFPGAGGGTGDFESDGTVSMTAPIDFDPGSDTDMDLITVAVTGTPTLSWDETENGFLSSTEFRTKANVLGVEDAAGSVDLGVIDSAGNFRHRTSGGVEQFRVESGSSHGVSIYNMPFQMRSGSVTGTKLFEVDSAGAVNVNTTNGIDYNPGSDIDTILMTVGVTGGPLMRWDESEDQFNFTRGVSVTTATSDFPSIDMTTPAGIDYNPGSDIDTDIITVGVTGSPRVFWDESDDEFESTKNWTIPNLVDLDSSQTVENKIFGNNNSWSEGAIQFPGVASKPGSGDFNGAQGIVMKTDATVIWTGNGVSGSNNVKTFTSDAASASLYNKTFDSTSTWVQGALTLKQGTSPTPTSEGVIEWDTDDNVLKIGDGSGTVTIGTSGGDLFSDGSVSMTAALDFDVGSDTDIDLVTVAVTGSPKLFWDESEDAFHVTKGLISDSETYGFKVSTSEFRNWDSADTDIDTVVAGSAFGTLFEGESSGHMTFSVKPNDSTDGYQFLYDDDFDGTVDTQFLSMTKASGFQWDGTYDFDLNGVKGIDFNPGSDADADLLTVGVTGAPVISWDESENKFGSTHGIILDGTSGQAPDYRIWDSTGDLVFRTYFGSFGSVSNWANLSANTRATVAIDSGDEGYLTLINSSNQEAIHADAGDGIQTDDLGISVRASVGSGTHRGGISSAGVAYGNNQAVTLGAAATTFAATSNFITLTGDGGGNNLATITGLPGPCLVSIVCTDSNVTFVDNNSHTANTFDLPSNIPGADDQTFLFHYDGTSFYFIYGSAN